MFALMILSLLNIFAWRFNKRDRPKFAFEILSFPMIMLGFNKGDSPTSYPEM